MTELDTLADAEVVVAGHVCLDIIPGWGSADPDFHKALLPGSLLQIGPATVSVGGAVSNTGIALHRLGVPVRLIGKVGDDPFGRTILQIIEAADPSLAKGMIIAPGENTSYTVVINPPNTDRIFLHHSGANDTFGAADIHPRLLRGARLFHFGYPPIMRRLYSDGGTELAQIFRSTRAQGAATSLDMTHVDRRSEAGKVNWIEFLRTVLPQVDLFLPSLDEILFMLQAEPCNSQCPDAGTLDGIADKLLKMGCAIVVLKLGENGLFVKTTESLERLRSVGGNLVPEPRRWLDRTVIAPNFIVEVAGTTGAGDCAIAGFLAGLLKGLALDEAATTAAAAGACCVEKVDATSGVPSWDALQKRIRSGWKRRPAIA